jgi:phage shock protein PspC (stress-responsive transcriptional regulator)
MDTTNTTSATANPVRRLHRPHRGRVLGGVAAGLADHTGASVALIRLGFVVSTLFAGFGVLLYLAAWALIPEQGAEQSAAERWLQNLTTPGRRLGAFLIGIAALIVLAGAAPVTILAAATLLAGAALLSRDNEPSRVTAAAAPAGTEEETE